MGLCFAMFVFLTFRGPLASHDSNPYPHRSRIARYNATKEGRTTPPSRQGAANEEINKDQWPLPTVVLGEDAIGP